MKSWVLGNVRFPPHTGPPGTGQKKTGSTFLCLRLSPAAILRQEQRGPRCFSASGASNSLSYSFLSIPATVPSITEAKSEGSRDWVGFSSGISREIVGAHLTPLEVPEPHIQTGRQKTGKAPRAFGHRKHSAPCSARPAIPSLCC